MQEHETYISHRINYIHSKIKKRMWWAAATAIFCIIIIILKFSLFPIFCIPLVVSVFCFFRFKKKYYSEPPITIDDTGFIDLRSGFGLIEAEDIISVGRLTVFNKRQLHIVVANLDKYMNRLDPKQRKKADRIINYGYSPIMINFDGLVSTPDCIWEEQFKKFWPRWKGEPLPPDPTGDELIDVKKISFFKGWAKSKKAYEILLEEGQHWNQSPLVTAPCKKDGDPCLVTVGRVRLLYTAREFLFATPYVGGCDIEDIKHITISQKYGPCQLKVVYKTGGIVFENIGAREALGIAETIASFIKMQRTVNCWKVISS